MAYDDVITRNDSDELAVRVVSVTEGTNNSSYDDVFTRDTNGKLAVRTVGNGGGGGGDSHNLGWYATPQALNEAHATAEAGDWAIVGSTDTVWIWDTDNSQWVDSDTKGQVTSVNNQTGAVTLTASDVGALPDNTHIPADPVQADWDEADSTALDYIKNKPTIPAAQVNSDWNANSGVAQILNKPTIPDPTQVSTLPTASADELGNIYQFVGTTDANYTNGYFYKCVSDGATPAVYSWEAVEVQASSGLQNTATGTGSLTILGTAATSMYTINIGDSTNGNQISSVIIGHSATSTGGESVAVGRNANTQYDAAAFGFNARATSYGVAIGNKSKAQGESMAVGRQAEATGSSSTAVGNGAKATAERAIQIGPYATNSEAGTLCVATKFNNATVNYKIMDADGTIPSDRLIHAINKYSTMPTASSTNEGWIVQFTGTTDSTYTHGHLYECVSDGADPATYSWTEVQLGGGGSSYTAGTGIDITGGVISVTSPTLQNTATGQYALTILGSAATQTRATNIGYNATAVDYGTSVGYNAKAGVGGVAIGDNANNSNKMRSTALGNQTVTNGEYAIAIGWDCGANANGAIQIGGKVGVAHTNTDANTFKVGNANGNYEMMSANGTIPTARLTKVNSTITLTAAGWSSNTQTVNVTGMTADGVVMVSPDPTDQSAYTSAGILCTAQASGTLTFTCDTVPSADIDVVVVML